MRESNLRRSKRSKAQPKRSVSETKPLAAYRAYRTRILKYDNSDKILVISPIIDSFSTFVMHVLDSKVFKITNILLFIK